MGYDLLISYLSLAEKIYPKCQFLGVSPALATSISMDIHLHANIAFVTAPDFPSEGELLGVQAHAYVPLSIALCRALSNDR